MPIEDALPGLENSYFMLNAVFEILVLYMMLGVGFLTIKFVRLSIGDNMIFGFLNKYQDLYVSKPFFGCEYCMASVWGTVIYFAACSYKGWVTFDVVTWIGFCVCLSGLMKYFDETRERVVLNVYEDQEEEEFEAPEMHMNGYADINFNPYDN